MESQHIYLDFYFFKYLVQNFKKWNRKYACFSYSSWFSFQTVEEFKKYLKDEKSISSDIVHMSPKVFISNKFNNIADVN